MLLLSLTALIRPPKPALQAASESRPLAGTAPGAAFPRKRRRRRRALNRTVYPDSPLRLSFTAPGVAPSGGAKTSQLWDPTTQNPLQDLDASNATLVDYVMGNRIDEPIGRVAGAATHAFVTDHLMSVRGLADGSGTLVNQYTYAAFGTGRSQVEFVANRLRFTARELDAATGQQYTRNRYLALALGRFTQMDPGRFIGGQFNPFSYGNNNPLIYVDPHGDVPWLILVPVILTESIMAVIAYRYGNAMFKACQQLKPGEGTWMPLPYFGAFHLGIAIYKRKPKETCPPPATDVGSCSYRIMGDPGIGGDI